MENFTPRTLGQLIQWLNANGISDYRRFMMMKRFLDNKARTKGIPISGSFELTPLCNLDCKMCYVHLNKEQLGGAKILTTEQWISIIDEAVKNGMMFARLTGGECLTHPGFKEIYLHLRSLGVETGILSNGLSMNDDMLAFLKEHKPSMIQITLYGASDDGYERVTGRRVFHTVLDNIRKIMAAGIPLAVVVTPNEFMTDGEDVVRLIHELQAPSAINSGLQTPREETGRELHDANMDAYVSMIKLRQELSGGQVLDTLDPEELPDKGGNGDAAYGVLCGAGRSVFAVDWRGEMKPCNNFPCEGRSVFELGFANAWRLTHETATHYQRPVECEGCRYQRVCKHCVAEHASGAPCGHASPAICAWVQRMVAEGLLRLT